ncbi:sigma-54-dependent transcriptional regulator [Actibacterium ureilyticum]|uniref:sigma-54-dependent transcriptional regulator n=1 Tax=Actibacterium ureilyticum TaxID=1590614 RepID=UPI000BAAE5F3|nr:sigma-54 dependent transcriptional regulator [Actibacterium ureilyticum]
MKPLLLVEDTPSLQMVYETVLTGAGHAVRVAANAADGLSKFADILPDVVLLDLMLPDRNGLDLMQDMLRLKPETNIIVVTANGSINRAVEAMRRGAYEFLLKPFNEQRLLNAVDNALSDMRPVRRGTPEAIDTAAFSEFVGDSAVMAEVYSRIQSVGRSMASVFIFGESGTGKEICAQAVHKVSHRASGPFVPLNCGAIPADLLESEVFGHLKGSFTGAISDKPGAAAVADGGTLFLDEICEMDLNLQTKLLRFLQTSTIQPVGAAHPRKVNVRIICATNRDPMEEVRRGRFREDLYYRLYVVPIHLPPLRDRGDDIVQIARAALARYSQEEGRDFSDLSADVRALFLKLPWPGNVRQLLNVLRNVVVLNEGPLVTLDMLPIELHHALEQYNDAPNGPAPAGKPHVTLDGLVGKTLAEIEQLVIEETIARHGGSIPKAARVLDVSPSTLYRKRENWGGGNR